MSETLEQIQQALAAATDEVTSESSAEEKVEDAVEDAKAPKGKPGAQARIQELVSARKAAEEKAAEYEEELKQTRTRLEKMTDLATEREKDSRLVAKINELYEKDPNLKPIIETLDAAVSGKEYKVNTATGKVEEVDVKPDAKALEEINKLRSELKQGHESLASQVADQKARAILSEADSVISSLLGQLPETYGDKDREVIAVTLDNEINWEAIEKDPDSLGKEIEAATQRVVNWYGDPRGALKADKTETTTEKANAKLTVEDIVNKNWGKLNEVGKDSYGRPKFEAAVSDADFSKVMGEAMRRSNSR